MSPDSPVSHKKQNTTIMSYNPLPIQFSLGWTNDWISDQIQRIEQLSFRGEMWSFISCLNCANSWQIKVTVWPDFAIYTILVVFGGFWQKFIWPKSPVHRSFDVDILGLEKFIYLLWWQIWRFLPKCWWFFLWKTKSHCKVTNLLFLLLRGLLRWPKKDDQI